jgi:hypothetical protein
VPYVQKNVRWVALLLLVAACGREWVREYEGGVPGACWDSATVFVVRDHLTGQPIRGAVVRQHPEWELGPDGEWAPLVEERRTDRFGIVTFPLAADPGNCHWTAHAQGYAPVEHYGTRAAAEIDLERGTERAGRLLGFDGAPVAGVTVEFKRGCAHAPALLEARTDREGMFLFPRAIDGDYCFEDPRFMADYWGGEEPGPRSLGVPTYRVSPGATLTGRVLRKDGTPPGWAVVLTNARGPRARVAADGSFALRGLAPGAPLFVWWDEGSVEFDPATCRPGGPVTFYVPEGPPDTVPVTVGIRARDVHGTPPRIAMQVHFDRIGDGRRFSFGWSPWQDAAEVAIPLGTYLVSAGDPASPLVAEPRSVEVRGPCEVEVVVHGQPALRFDRSRLPQDAHVICALLLEDQWWSIDDALKHGDEVHLPSAARAWLRVRIYKQFECDFPIGPECGGVRSTAILLPGRKEIRVSGLSGRYEVSRLHGELDTYAVGTRWVAVDHDELGHTMARLELPFEAATVDVTDLAFEPWKPQAELRVVDAEGRPVPDAEVHVLDGGDDFERYEEEFGPGTHLRVAAPGCLPLWTTLSGAPPYEIRLGGAAVEVDLKGFEGARCLFDTVAWLEPSDDGCLLLKGIPAGPHVLVVGAPGRTSLVFRLVLREGETRRIRPELPPRE